MRDDDRIPFDTDFDIDIDLAPVLRTARPCLVNARWYELLRERPERAAALQSKIEASFRNVLLRCEWQARRERIERRRALRAPLLSRVHVAPGSTRLVACDVSTTGLRCSGRPQSGVLDIEFKLPGLAFPVAARAEVAEFRDGNVLPLAGLRFVDIERAYVEHIAQYVRRRRSELYADGQAAA